MNWRIEVPIVPCNTPGDVDKALDSILPPGGPTNMAFLDQKAAAKDLLLNSDLGPFPMASGVRVTLTGNMANGKGDFLNIDLVRL